MSVAHQCLAAPLACQLLALTLLSTNHRDFVMSSYKDLKKTNPTFPILVREAESAQARLIARYGACTMNPYGPRTARSCASTASSLSFCCSLIIMWPEELCHLLLS